MKRNILCFAPHPDDEIIGCGGFLLKNIKDNIAICYLTLGEHGGLQMAQLLSVIRKKESRMVTKRLKIDQKKVFYLNIPDNTINSNDYQSFCKIISIIRQIKPNIVLIPHAQENYFDHREASLLIQRALDMAGSHNFPELGNPWWTNIILAYEVSTPMQKYQYSEEISKVIKEKIELLKIYKSQTKNAGNLSDFVGEKIKFMSGYRAAMSVGKHREVFQVLRVNKI